MAATGERTVLAAFLVSAALAGGNAVGIRFSNRELDPLWGAGLRFGLAALLLLALLFALRLDFPRGQALAGAALFGVLNFGIGFALAYVALVELHAGFGQVLLALVPLATLLLAVLQGQERLHPAAILGTVLALAGVALMARAPCASRCRCCRWWRRSAAPCALHRLRCSFDDCRRFIRWRSTPWGWPSVQSVCWLRRRSLATASSCPPETETWLALAYLVVVGSVVVFLLYLFVLGRWRASRAAYVFVLIPFVTVLLSAWLDDEPITSGLVLGGALVLAGVYIGVLRQTANAS